MRTGVGFYKDINIYTSLWIHIPSEKVCGSIGHHMQDIMHEKTHMGLRVHMCSFRPNSPAIAVQGFSWKPPT